MAARLRQILRLPGRTSGRVQTAEVNVDVVQPECRASKWSPHGLTRIAPGRPVVKSVLGRPAASVSSGRASKWKVPHCLTRITPGRPVVMSVLGRPAASGSSSPRQGVGNGPVRVPLGRQDNFFLNGLVNFFVDKCLLAPGRGVSRHPTKRKKGSRKETPAIRNHWFDKMHQSAEEGGRQRCSSISSNHHEKNGWDEHRPVIFRKPTHLHTEKEGWPRR